MKLYWADLETTGLDPQKDTILEISVFEAELSDPFNIKKVYASVLGLHDRSGLSPFILDMHTKNGLLDECQLSTKIILDVEEDLLSLIPEEKNREDKPIWAGSSIHFDVSFIKIHMPSLSKRFSHRHYDVSAIKLFCQSLGMETFKKAEAHRATDDIEESVAHAKDCVGWLKNKFTNIGK